MMKVESIVFKKNGKPRKGKGFSREELRTAGLSFREALKSGVSIDIRRRTIHKENVEAVKSFKSKKTRSKSGEKPKS
jgi:large subunit ribosomal protein L13e